MRPVIGALRLDLSVNWRTFVSRMFLITALPGVVYIIGCSGRPAPAPTPGKTAQPSVQPEQQAPEKTASQPKEQVQSTIQGAKFTWYDKKGRPVLVAEFSEAEASSDSTTTARLRNVKAVLYREGKPASTLNAPVIAADSKTREVRASGGVTLTSAAQNARVQAPNITWKSTEGKVYATGGVKLVQGDMVMEARNLVADTALRKARLTDGNLNVR